MKKQLLALSMIATSGLVAQDGSATHQTMQQDCCEPCCNNSRPCVDRECYTPPFHNLQSDCGFFFDLEFLYWYAKETNLSYANTVQLLNLSEAPSDQQLILGANTYHYQNTGWDPGFRIGVGFNSNVDGWGYNLTWTWYRNQRSDSVSVDHFALADTRGIFPYIAGPDQFMLFNPWVNASIHIITAGTSPTGQAYGVGFDCISANYRIRFNQIDLDVGKKYWLSKCFNMRPFIGIRGAWTHVNFSTTSSRSFTLNSTDYSQTFVDEYKTKAWGIGFIAGFEPTWYLGQYFSIYSKAGTGAIWGDFEVDKIENYTGVVSSQPGTIFPNFQNIATGKQGQMTGLLDLSMGIRWESTWCYDRYRSTIDLGWEHHIFFDQNHRYKTTDFVEIPADSSQSTAEVGGYRTYDEATGNLGFGGLVLRANFDF
jgi:hypothetical protein